MLVHPAAGRCAASIPGRNFPKNPLGNPVRGPLTPCRKTGTSPRASVQNPPGDPVKKPMVHAPYWGEGGGPCAPVTLVYPLSDREGKARCGSRQRPPRRGEKFVTFQCCGGVLRPQTLTNSTQFLRDKALYHVEVTTLHWNPFLSVGGEREDLHSKLEIFLERSRVEDSICGRSVYFSLARLTGREAVCRCLGGIAHSIRVDQRSPLHAAVRTANSLS